MALEALTQSGNGIFIGKVSFPPQVMYARNFCRTRELRLTALAVD